MPSPPSDLEIAPLGHDDVIGTFTCGDADLDDFLRNDAGRLRDGSTVQTHHPVIPAVKVARIGVSAHIQRRGGIGTALVRFAFFKAQDLATEVGCRLLTLDAYPEAIEFYRRLGFVVNREKEYRGRPNPSMRLDLFSEAWPEWV